MTTQTYRRARHSVSALQAHLVLVTTYRRPLVTDEMLTFAEHTTRTVCPDLDVELVEFNGETDHLHLLVAYPPTMAISTLIQRLKNTPPRETTHQNTHTHDPHAQPRTHTPRTNTRPKPISRRRPQHETGYDRGLRW